MLITTTDVLQGVEISEYIGPVVATTVTSTGKTLFKDATKTSLETMQLVSGAVEKVAKEVGADAVIGLDVVPLQAGTQLFCSGTAVKLKK